MVCITPENQQAALAQLPATVVNPEVLPVYFGCSLEQWLATNHLRVCAVQSLTMKAARGPQDWLVVETSSGPDP